MKARVEEIRLERGERSDLRSLEAFHYRAGSPATVELIVRAREGTETVGVLAVSRPVLNGPWRERAWPGRYAGIDRRLAARRINREIRAISRVIVDPRYRGLGVARRMVRAYLDDPITERTEAVASMARMHPFFALAGMRVVGGSPSRRSVRFHRLLRSLRIEPDALVDLDRAERLLRDSPALREGVRVWARDARTSRRLGEAAAGDPVRLSMLAAMAGAEAPAVYVYDEAHRLRMNAGSTSEQRR